MIIEHEAAYERARKRSILGNANKTWRLNTLRHEEIEDALGAGRDNSGFGGTVYSDDFIGSVAKAFDTFGKLSPNQSAAILKGIDARAARKAEWASKEAAINAQRQHVGAVGEKLAIELTVKKIIRIEGAKFSYYDSGVTYLHICEDAAQNVVLYKGKSNNFPCEGETALVKCAVKEHGVRNGVKQTYIQRPKLAA